MAGSSSAVLGHATKINTNSQLQKKIIPHMAPSATLEISASSTALSWASSRKEANFSGHKSWDDNFNFAYYVMSLQVLSLILFSILRFR